MDDENTDLSAIDSRQEMRKFMDAILERAKDLPPNVAERTKPDVAAKALWMLSQGATYKAIRKITGLGHETLRRLEWDHNATLENKRKQFVLRYGMAAQEYTDLLFEQAQLLADDEEALKRISPDKLATVVGIMQDKASTLAGMATSVVEHKRGTSLDEAAEMIKMAKQRAADRLRESAIDAEIIE